MSHRTTPRHRDIVEFVCDEPTCEFYGKQAAQGVCHTTDVFEPEVDRYIRRVEKSGEDMLAESRLCFEEHQRRHPDASWVAYLESQLVCDWMNHQFVLDECIQLRAENAKLRLRLGEYDLPPKEHV